MSVFIVFIDNGDEYPEDFEMDTCGVFLTLEEARTQEAPEGWEINHIEEWKIGEGYVTSYFPDEEEEYD